MKKVLVHVDGVLYRGPRPKSFAALIPHGVTDVINLQSGVKEVFSDDVYEHEKAWDFGMVEHNVRCSDFTPPTAKQVQQVFDIIANAKGNVYIHCLHGKDRTGFMCAAYRMQKQGWDFFDAKAEMFSYGFHKFPYLWWLFALKTYEK